MQRGCLCSPLLAVDPHSLSKQTVERLVNKIRIFFSLREGGGKKKFVLGEKKKIFSFLPLPASLSCCAAGTGSRQRGGSGQAALLGWAQTRETGSSVKAIGAQSPGRKLM